MGGIVKVLCSVVKLWLCDSIVPFPASCVVLSADGLHINTGGFVKHIIDVANEVFSGSDS